MNPACDVSPDELIAYTEEDLPEHRLREIENHIPTCPVCQERLGEGKRIAGLLRSSMPEPPDYARHDLMVRLYQEAEDQTDHPHREWGQVAGLTAICGTFLVAALLLWSGLGQVVDVIRSPFQEARPDQSIEWITEDGTDEEAFETAPSPDAVGEGFPLHDQWVRAGIRVLVYQDADDAGTVIEVNQFPVDDPEPPDYMTEAGEIDGTAFAVDDPDAIREIRWIDDGLVHHAELHHLDSDPGDARELADAAAIVRAFLDEE